MNKKFLIAETIAVLSFVLLLFLGVNYFNTPAKANVQQNGTMHTYLVKIPNSAGVCPYQLMSMTKGKLKMIKDSRCVCPYGSNASYMTTRCKDIKSVIAMLPSHLQNKIQVKIIDKPEKETRTKIL